MTATMKKTTTRIIAAALVASTASLSLTDLAEAGPRHRQGHHGHQMGAPLHIGPNNFGNHHRGQRFHGPRHHGPRHHGPRHNAHVDHHALAAAQQAHRRNKRHKRNEAIAIGVAGLVIGAMIASSGRNQQPAPSTTYYGPNTAPSANPYPDYYAPQYSTGSRPGQHDNYAYNQAYQGQEEQWIGSAEWVDYCRKRYKTFDAESGTFMHNSGVRKLCQ